MQIKLPLGRRTRRSLGRTMGCLVPDGGKAYINKLFLHIGLPKTGTTSIQAYCLRNRQLLAENGILYPQTGLEGPGHMKLCPPFLSDIQNQRSVVKSGKKKGFRKFGMDLQNEIDACAKNIDRMLISSERFSIVQGEGLTKLTNVFKRMSVFPILYLRRQDLLAESLHAQAYRVRSPYFEPDKLLHLRKPTFCFWDLISTWRNAFGEDNLIVRKFQKRSVTFDFLEAIDIQNKDQLPEEFRLNAVLSRDAMEYLRHHTDLVFGSSEYSRVERRLVEFSKTNPTPVHFKRFFSPQERIRLLESYAEQNRLVAREIFGEPELFSDEFPSLDEPWEKYPGLAEATKREIEEFIQTAKAA